MSYHSELREKYNKLDYNEMSKEELGKLLGIVERDLNLINRNIEVVRKNMDRVSSWSDYDDLKDDKYRIYSTQSFLQNQKDEIKKYYNSN